MAAYQRRALFGGAITADFPEDILDASDVRQVPDNQEVLLSKTGLTSAIIEISERAEPPDHPCTTDDQALEYHYNDIIAAGYGRDEPDEVTRIWSREKTVVPSLGEKVPAYKLFATQHPVQQPRSSDAKPLPDFTAILLVLIRLEVQKADLLITVNVPHVSGEYQTSEVDLAGGKLGPLLDAAVEERDRILASFRIEDWGLFAGE